jgi:hypothetical protein
MAEDAVPGFLRFASLPSVVRLTVGMTIGKKYWQETDNIVKVNRTAGLKPDSLGNLRHGHSLMRCSHPFAKNAKGWGTRH